MSTVFALALRLLLTASLLLAGGGAHAAPPTASSKVEASAAAAQPPCHGEVDSAVDGDLAASASDGLQAHCGDDCQCPCIALPMLVPNDSSVIVATTDVVRSWRFVLPWRSTPSLPDLRPPIV